MGPAVALRPPTPVVLVQQRPAHRQVGRCARSVRSAMAVPQKAAVAQPGRDLGKGYDKMYPPPGLKRRAGVLLHPTSLPGPHGAGDLGEEAFQFVDFLASAGLSVWQARPRARPEPPKPAALSGPPQVLPLVPPDGDYWSPYSGQDANCGNVLLIALGRLVDDGLLAAADLPAPLPAGDANFPAVAALKRPLLAKAAAALLARPASDPLFAEMAAFRAEPDTAAWLEEAALFAAIASEPEHAGLTWPQWAAPIRTRQPAALASARARHAADVAAFVALQFLFDRQWRALKAHAASRQVALIGDMPIYVGGHSADVWANPGLFAITAEGVSLAVSGVPPDAFSETGQLWGSPLYDWAAHKREGYAWWGRRLRRAMVLYDETRVDHFRAFAGYWAVPATETTAMNGAWLEGPGRDFFDGVTARVGGRLKILAEDLGVITADVVALREAIAAPGMAVMQFAFGSDAANPHLPHNHRPNEFVYPGTHDNDTTLGWYRRISGAERAAFHKYLNKSALFGFADAPALMLQAAMASVAYTVVVQAQDLLGLDNRARMNTPGRAAGNWAWRLTPDTWAQLQAKAPKLRDLGALYGRLPDEKKSQE